MTKAIKKKYEINMTEGAMFGKIIRFALPLMIASCLQLLFNAADIIVVGRYTGSIALAAVGSTASLTHMLVNLFMGVSVGVNVLTARSFAIGKQKEVHETVHTAITLSVICGFLMLVTGVFLSEPILQLMGTPDNVINDAVLYIRIYFLGMPFLALYNFGSSILRAVGDTKRPLYFLVAAGILNVALNLFLVIVFKMGVAGVAIATTISQALSATLVIICLCKTDAIYKLEISKLRIYKDKLLNLLRIGIPAGIQGTLISFSNMTIQSSVNSFGSYAMAGYAAANNVEGFLYVSVNALSQATLTVTSQNMGVKNYKRVDRGFLECMAISLTVATTLGCLAYIFGDSLLHLYTTDEEAISYGVIKFLITCIPYGLCGLMDAFPNFLRGQGYSIAPTIISLAGTCLFRILWVMTIFRHFHTLESLYISFPVSWGFTALLQFVCYLFIRRKREKV